MSVMQLGHLLTRSDLTYLEASSEVFLDSFCQLGNSVSLSWVVCREAFCLHVASSITNTCGLIIQKSSKFLKNFGSKQNTSLFRLGSKYYSVEAAVGPVAQSV